MRLRTAQHSRAVITVALTFGIAGCATTVEQEQEALPPVAQPAPPTAVPRLKPAVVPPPKIEAEAPPEPQRPPAPVTRTSDVDSLITDFQRLRRLSPADVIREQETARQAFSQSRTDNARVLYAMTLALPGTLPADESRALDMLDPVVRNGASSLNGFAVLLASYIQEQRRLGTQVQALQQKLEALRTLERNLSERRR